MTETDRAWIWFEELASRQENITDAHAYTEAMRKRYDHPEHIRVNWWRPLGEGVPPDTKRPWEPPATDEDRKELLENYLQQIGRQRKEIEDRTRRYWSPTTKHPKTKATTDDPGF